MENKSNLLKTYLEMKRKMKMSDKDIIEMFPDMICFVNKKKKDTGSSSDSDGDSK